MTICISVKVHDCLVFAADSASSISATDKNGNQVLLKVFQHGNKLFNLYKKLPVAGMTCGMGNIGETSISTLSKDFRLLIRDNNSPLYIDENNYTIEQFASKAYKFFFEDKYKSLAIKPKSSHSFEFWIEGYGTAQFV